MNTTKVPKVKLTTLDSETVFLLNEPAFLTVNRKVRAIIIPVDNEDQALRWLDDLGLLVSEDAKET